jgi:hypothetical protein
MPPADEHLNFRPHKLCAWAPTPEIIDWILNEFPKRSLRVTVRNQVRISPGPSPISCWIKIKIIFHLLSAGSIAGEFRLLICWRDNNPLFGPGGKFQ